MNAHSHGPRETFFSICVAFPKSPRGSIGSEKKSAVFLTSRAANRRTNPGEPIGHYERFPGKPGPMGSRLVRGRPKCRALCWNWVMRGREIYRPRSIALFTDQSPLRGYYFTEKPLWATSAMHNHIQCTSWFVTNVAFCTGIKIFDIYVRIIRDKREKALGFSATSLYCRFWIF